MPHSLGMGPSKGAKVSMNDSLLHALIQFFARVCCQVVEVVCSPAVDRPRRVLRRLPALLNGTRRRRRRLSSHIRQRRQGRRASVARLNVRPASLHLRRPNLAITTGSDVRRRRSRDVGHRFAGDRGRHDGTLAVAARPPAQPDHAADARGRSSAAVSPRHDRVRRHGRRGRRSGSGGGGARGHQRRSDSRHRRRRVDSDGDVGCAAPLSASAARRSVVTGRRGPSQAQTVGDVLRRPATTSQHRRPRCVSRAWTQSDRIPVSCRL